MYPTTITGSDQLPQPTGTATTDLATATLTTKQWWKVDYTVTKDYQPLLEGIRNKTAICVTDGSYKNQQATEAYILKSDINSADSQTFVNQTPGKEEDQYPFRAEFAGIYGCIKTVTDLARQANIEGLIEL